MINKPFYIFKALSLWDAEGNVMSHDFSCPVVTKSIWNTKEETMLYGLELKTFFLGPTNFPQRVLCM